MKTDSLLACFIGVLLTFTTSFAAAQEYLGGQACVDCHQAEHEAWKGSHHQLAMQIADDKSVLGDFSGSEFHKDDVATRFYRNQDKYMVNTDGPDGQMQDFQIAYVFGVYPLQQYMVEFSGGRIQVLDIAWDSRPAAQGGQRWYSLHPDEKVPAGDVLHWTGPNLNWNYMCADCHSTNLLKNYNADNETYQTSWTDINVSCEACHGPGSEHKEWAEATEAGQEFATTNYGLSVVLNEREGVHWSIDQESGQPIRSEKNNTRVEIEVCARCHSRRSQFRDDFVPGQAFMDAYHPVLLDEGLYHVDGQMQDEVYVWGSFRQSKMYQSGVTCSDCHDAHRADLKATGEQVCYQCHMPTVYAQEAHHHHEPGSDGASCVECHMPPSTLMGVDQRHDHAFRIPRPDISQVYSTPNACNQCHDEQNSKWAVEQMRKWYGSVPHGSQDYAATFSAARQGSGGASSLLQRMALDDSQSEIARATALSYMGAAPDQSGLMLIQQGLNDEDALVRLGALGAIESLPEQYRILALPSVWDEVVSVRMQAARLMVVYPRDQLNAERLQKVDDALAEYIQSQLYSAERPEAQLNLAGLYRDQQEFVDAEIAFRMALKLQAKFIPAYINFADMLSELNRETEAANLLAAGIEEVPESADLYHALGLAKVRQKKLLDAVSDLARAASFAPDNRRYQYVYAVGLQSTNRVDEAIAVLEIALQRFTDDPEMLYALVTFNRDAGKREVAHGYAQQLKALLPGNPQIEELERSLNPDDGG